MNDEQFDALLQELEPRIRGMSCRVLPSSFDPDSPSLRALPRPLEWRWRSAEKALRHMHARGILSRIPFFWQMQPIIHDACRAVPAPTFSNEPQNPPIGIAALKSAGLDTVLTIASDVPEFVRALHERDVPLPKKWLVVHPLVPGTVSIETPPELMTNDISIAQEIHLFPGVPLFVQCDTLIDHAKAQFHVSSEFAIRLGVTSTSVQTIETGHLAPLDNFETPHIFCEIGSCDCGQAVYAYGHR